MKKFQIKYVLGAPSLNDATLKAHEILYKSDTDVDSVSVAAIDGSGRPFAEKRITEPYVDGTDNPLATETNPEHYERITNRLADTEE